jgi:hypothetical protein
MREELHQAEREAARARRFAEAVHTGDEFALAVETRCNRILGSRAISMADATWLNELSAEHPELYREFITNELESMRVTPPMQDEVYPTRKPFDWKPIRKFFWGWVVPLVLIPLMFIATVMYWKSR